MRRTLTVFSLALLAAFSVVALSACGKSKEETAQAKVCKSRDEIAKQIKVLAQSAAGKGTLADSRTAANKMGVAVGELKLNAANLSATNRATTLKAKQQFESYVAQIAKSLTEQAVATRGKGGLQETATALAQAYALALKPLKC